MYKVTRTDKLKETFVVEAGEDRLELTVDIDIDAFIGKYNRTRAELLAATDKVKDGGQSAVYGYGEAVVALLRLVFGDEQAAQLLAFYDGRYSALLIDVYPFLNDVVVPEATAASAARRQQLTAAAKAARQHGKRTGKHRWGR